MLRTVLCMVALLALLAGGPLTAGDKKTSEAKADKGTTADKGEKKGHKATITKVDAKKGTLKVKMKNKEGKEVEKTFRLTADVRMLDSTGRVAVIDVFRSGDEVLVIEEEGRLRQVQQHKGKGNKSGEKNPAQK